MADLRKYVAVKPTRLTAGISAVATSVGVAALQDIDGNTITMSDLGDEAYGVFEPKSSSKREIFKITGISSTTMTVARGGSAKSPYTFSGTGKTHSAGTQVVFYTNAPQLYDTFANKYNDETIVGDWTFDADNPPQYDANPTFGSGTHEFASVKFVEDTANAGAANGSTTVKGLFEEATQAEIDAGTAAGGTSARLAVNPSTLATSIYGTRLPSSAQKTLLDGITASAAELNVLDGFTGTTGNLNDVVSYYLGLPTANTWTAGENLTQNDVVKIQNYAGAGEKLYKLQGTVTKQTIPQALADGATAVFLDDTTVLIAESNTSDTSLDVRAYTINATTGALSLIHSLTIGSFFSANANVKLKSARISSTKAIFLGEGSAGACKVVAVQLSGGTLTNGSVVNTSGTGTPLGIWNVDGVITFAMIKSAGADTCILQTFSESGLVVTSVDSDSFTSFGNSASPSGASASKIDDNTYVASGNNAGTDLNFAIASVDNAGSITKGTVEAIAVDKFALVAGYNVGSNLNFVMLIDDTSFRRYSVSGVTATLEATTSSSLSITEDGDGMYAFQKSALVFNGALEAILDLGALTTRTLPSAFITVGTTGRFFVPSTADGRYVLASLDDELQIGSFDWGEADGVVAEAVTSGNTTELLKTSYEIIGTLSSLTRGIQYNLTQGGSVSADSTNSAFPIYTAIDSTRAKISDVL